MTVEEQAQTASYEAQSAENVRKEEKERKKKSLSREILRFVIVGVICTIIDFLVQMLFFWVFENNLSTQEGWGSYVAFAIATPANSNGQNRWLRNGQFIYEPEGWIPAGWNIWWFNTEVSLPAYSQIVVAIYGAINHTRTYSNSVDLSDAGYYAMYDPEAFGEKYNTNYYPNPSDNIDPSHYLQTYLFSQGTAWPVSNTGPAFYILECGKIVGTGWHRCDGRRP